MNDVTNNQQPTTDNRRRYHCRHIFTNGHRCGSPALRGEPFCYYHHTTRRPAPRQSLGKKSSFDLPLPEDRSAIQLAIGTILQRIASNDLDSKRPGLLLYGLQIASLNIPKQKEAEEPASVEEITTHPELGPLAPETEIKEKKSSAAQLLEQFRQKPAILPQIQATADQTTDSKHNQQQATNNQLPAPPVSHLTTRPNTRRVDRHFALHSAGHSVSLNLGFHPVPQHQILLSRRRDRIQHF